MTPSTAREDGAYRHQRHAEAQLRSHGFTQKHGRKHDRERQTEVVDRAHARRRSQPQRPEVRHEIPVATPERMRNAADSREMPPKALASDADNRPCKGRDDDGPDGSGKIGVFKKAWSVTFRGPDK